MEKDRRRWLACMRTKQRVQDVEPEYTMRRRSSDLRIGRATLPAKTVGTFSRKPLQKLKSLPREEVRQAFQKNRTAAGRRRAAIPTGSGEEDRSPETRRTREEVRASMRLKILRNAVS